MSAISINLTNLTKKMYKGRDISHGLNHVLKVRDNAMLISKELNINDSYELIKIEAASLFHDLWDHKYINIDSIDYKIIKDKFYSELKKLMLSDQEIKDIEIIINNISLSREIELRNNDSLLSLKHLQQMRDIVSDADKLEMLGISGIERIVEYEIYKNPNTKSDKLKEIVKTIYENKIIKLLDENYIKTRPGIEMAKPLMEEMKRTIKYTKI
jgi:HD superfamily phosphodiesterase